ncbi:MAG: hypothetical protein JOY68_04760, partial [Candidatus Dormibacteraeota bacterium]|nr:hypothetical protein [Candidatus Dormibacteraeota bacterium]
MTEISGRVLTFLIADVRGYTSFTRQRGDEAAARLAAKFAEIAREGVEWHGGTVTELRGDEALCVFTSPRAALRAALDLQTAYREESALEPTLSLPVGIGLDAGEAVAVEGGYRGSSLNLAARLCSKAGPGEVLLSQGIAHVVGTLEDVRLEPNGTAELKGLPEPVNVFRAAWTQAPFSVTEPQQPHEIPAALRIVAPMIGRDAEIRHLRWSWRLARRASTAEAIIKSVRGPTGIGKTRLLAELGATTAATGPVTYVPLSVEHPEFEALVRSIEPPGVLLLDDLETASPADLAQLETALTSAPHGLLVVLADDDERATPELTGLIRRLAPGASTLRLPPLTQHEALRLAAMYLGDSTDMLPAEVFTRSAGVPRRLHEAVGRWAYEQATRRLGDLATQAAADRSELRSVEADLAGTVIDLQLVREQSRLFGLTPGRYDAETQRPPYLGLTSFQPDDAAFFFGRERLVADMVARLAGAAMLGVVGPSGSGKSSAVRAGLVPALRAGALPGSESWTIAVIRPGEHPSRSLERAVWTEFPKLVASALEESDAPLQDLTRALGPGQQAVFVIDQFEEVFTACEDPAEQLAFLALVADMVSRGDGRVIAVLAIRADYYGRCSAHPAMAELLGSNHVLVGPMSTEEYRRVIVQPAARTMVEVEPELVDDLVADVHGEPGALPLLSTTLLELWMARDGRTMRRSAYLESGGVRGAVARLAERVYSGLDHTQQSAARSIFLRLAGAGEGDAAVRRRVALAEFDADRDPAVATTLDALATGRLLTISEGSVEVAHEALLREWPRLQGWLDEDREGQRLHAHLIAAASDWDSRGRDTADLYRGARLSAALDWTATHTPELNERERDFVTRSREQSQREVARQRRQNRRLRSLLAGVAALLIVAIAAGLVAFGQKQSADAAARVALARQLGAEALIAPRVDEALLLAREAVLLDASAQTESTLLATLLRAPSAIGTFSTPIGVQPEEVAVSGDGRTLAVSENTGAVNFFDTRTYRQIHAPLSNYNGGLVGLGTMGYAGPFFYSIHVFPPRPSGPNPPETLDLFDAASMVKMHSFTVTDTFINNSTGPIDPVLGSPDGRDFWFVFDITPGNSSDGTTYVDRWETSSGKVTELALPTVGLGGAELLAGDRLLVVTDSGVVTVDGLSMRELSSIPLNLGSVQVSAISPDGKRLATTSGNGGTFAIWDLTAQPPQMITPSESHAAGINGLEFTPDSRDLVTASADDTAAVWDAASGTLVTRLTGHSSAINGLSVSPDGAALYTASADGVVLQWDLSGALGFGRPFQFPAFSS